MYRTLVVSLAVAFAACSKPSTSAAASAPPQAAAAPAGGTVQFLDAQQFKYLAEQKNGLFLDVRTPGEVAYGHIPGATVIDINDDRFPQKVSLLPRDRPIFIYCASGSRSAAAAAYMHKIGFKELYNLSNGIGTWARAGFPIERGSGPMPTSADAMQPAAFDAAIHGASRVLVDFQTPWCQPCRKMAPIVDALAEEQKGLKVLRVDVEQSEALASREKVDGVPTFVYYVDGKERWRKSGEQTRATLEAGLAQN